MAGSSLYSENTLFAYVALDEPEKADVLAWAAGTGPLPERAARVALIDVTTGESTDNIVSLTREEIISSTVVDGSTGQLPILEQESTTASEILQTEPAWLAALEARGLTPGQVQTHALSAGGPLPSEQGRRMVRVVAFASETPSVEMYFHPIDGLTAYVDLIERQCLEVIDTGAVPVPQQPGAFTDPQQRTNGLDTLRPIEITQPEGPSFTIDGDRVTWANWNLQVGYDPREGLLLRNISIADGAERRPLIYRASLSEMVVPYGDPKPTRFWHNFFDFGEFQVAKYAVSLEHGCDCLGEIAYLDVVSANENGYPVVIKNGICVHEEDYSVLWKHTELIGGHEPFSDMRRSRRLVVSSFVNAGNYDYGFYWYFYLDGTIQCEVKLTGILFPSYYPGLEEFGTTYPYANQVAPGLGAHYHQHLFGARLDMTVDGVLNNVDEVDAVRIPVGDANPYGNAFTQKATRITSEAVSGRVADSSVGRVWRISSAHRTNWTGAPTSYVLIPSTGPTLMSDAESPNSQRTQFATKHLFVTKYHRDERFAAGEWVNQSPAGQGVPAYIADDEPLEDADVVLWHTFGPTHFPRLEDWPVMPVDTAEFTLKPLGFFDRNPTLGMPAADQCAAPSHQHHHH